MKKYLLLILLLITTSCQSAPKIVFDTQIHNFGTVKQNVAVSHTFRFINQGKDPLHIKRISPS